MLMAIGGLLVLVAVLIRLGTPERRGRGVLIQVTDVQRLSPALAHASATSVAMPEVEIILIVCGPAIAGLTRNSPAGREIERARAHGIRVRVCEDSMQSLHLAREDMYPGLDYVPSALTEIVRKQFGGWIYVRS
jgi:intracellular sulfur oxidation DsrE/DsrF family protein